MRVNIDHARDGLRAIFETTGVTTIKDLRASYREYRALQRDLATVRAYVWNLERDVEAGRAQEQGRAEPPKILVETGIISQWEPVTAHAISSFMEAWKQFQAVVAEEDGLKRRIHELMRDLDSRREEEEKLKVRQSAMLREMGVAAVQELDWAIMGRQEYDRLKLQVQPLEERVQTLLQGASLETAQAEYQDALATVKRYEDGHPDKRVGVDPGKVEEYRAAFRAAQEVFAAAQGEGVDLEAELEGVLERARAADQPAAEGAAAAVAVSPVEALTRRIQEVYREITLQEIVPRVVEERGRPVLQVQRPGGGGGWMSPSGLGRAASELLQCVLRVELAVGPCGGNHPLVLENPFTRLDPQRQQRAAAWLISVSGQAQLFAMVEEAELRDLLRGLLEARGVGVTAVQEGDVDLLTAQTPAA